MSFSSLFLSRSLLSLSLFSPPLLSYLGLSAGGVYTIASTSALGAAAAASKGVLSTARPYRDTEAPKE